MESLLVLMFTRYHPMITLQPNPKPKPWIRFALRLLALALIMGTTGCNGTASETWYCYDTQGHPVEDVFIVCRYGLPEIRKSGVNYRLSDARGRIILGLDEDTPDGLDRAYDCIYSPKLRSGSVGLGERWHEGQPIPKDTVYFDEWNNKIYLNSGIDDPVIWHKALNNLIRSYLQSRNNPNGGVKLNAYLSVLVPRERALFLEKYGEQIVPRNYNYIGSLDTLDPRYAFLSKRNNANLKFKDITTSLPKP